MPRDDLLRVLRNHIRQAVIKHYGDSSCNIFDGVIELLNTNWSSSPTTIAEIRQGQKTKSKGDLFEHFALLYFQHCYPDISNVWLLQDAPEHVLEFLRLRRNDLGIDLLLEHGGLASTATSSAVTSTGISARPRYSAVQVKYRKQPRYKQRWGVTWQDLSTFYALVTRTGPYQRHIVLTNAHWVRHIGRKSKFDQSICIGTLRNITAEQWEAMAGFKGHQLTDKSPSPEPESVPGPKVPRRLSRLSRLPRLSRLSRLVPKIAPTQYHRPDLMELRRRRLAYLEDKKTPLTPVPEGVGEGELELDQGRVTPESASALS